MLTLPARVRIFLCLEPINMHRSFDGLAAQVRERLARDPRSGHVFLFVNRRGTLCKALVMERTGYVIVYKRLSGLRFRLPRVDGSVAVELEPAQLQALLEGLEPVFAPLRSGARR